MAKRRELEWTPPIFGWQYKLHWQRYGSETRVDSWDWNHWPEGSRYFIWVQGTALGVKRVHWNVFFNANHPTIRVRFCESGYSLTKAIRKIERQVRALELAVLELREHSKRAGASEITLKKETR